MDRTKKLAPPGATGNGPTMSIPHWEKGHAHVIDVISCFGFLGMDEWICFVIFETTDCGPACIPQGALVYFLDDVPRLYWPYAS
ncbi:hypothetical protein Tco_0620840 [Tanacetum coccineum]